MQLASDTSTPKRRLSVRRGSISAADPYGRHAHLTESVQSSCTLSIVRVISPPQTTPLPPDPISSSPRRYHRRLGSHPSQSPTATTPDNTRLSFAFSSFAGPAPAPGGPATNTSPSSSPRLRPSSPHRLSALPSKTRLNPDQLLDLARSTDPRYNSTQSNSRSSSPSLSPLLRAHSPIGQHSSTAPATFTPLPDYIYLPFIDRPSEVTSLISSPPSAKLFSLLAQIFRNPATPIQPPSSSPYLPEDPTKWTYSQLHEHLTTITRSQMPDTLWVALARKCVLFHSELIWERIKGALGVPPELDVDYDLYTPFGEQHADNLSSSASSVDTDEISDDHGRSARGHWEDWDAVMDSPVFDRRHSSALTPPSPIITLPTINFRRPSTGVGDKEDLLGSGFCASPIKDSDSHTPAFPSSFLSIEPILIPTSPSNILSPVAPSNFSLSSETIGVMGLGDIQESAEDETETESSTPNEKGEKSLNNVDDETQDPDLISPTQIQGLRISTSPLNLPSTPPNLLSSSHSISSLPNAPPNSNSSLSAPYIAPSPISPLPPYPSIGTARPGSRSSSISSSVGVGSFRRSGSWGSLASAMGGEEEEEGYNPVGDRAPGNPLFPSNFARLAVGPTLVANNPTLRSPPLPPQSRYSTNLSVGLYRSVHGQKRRTYSHGAAGVGGMGTITRTDVNRRQSWGHGTRAAAAAAGSVQGNDYAVSVTSVGSVGE